MDLTVIELLHQLRVISFFFRLKAQFGKKMNFQWLKLYVL